MELRAELLKSIWYAFTALDAEKSGKVSKSQLKVSKEGGKRRLEAKGAQRPFPASAGSPLMLKRALQPRVWTLQAKTLAASWSSCSDGSLAFSLRCWLKGSPTRSCSRDLFVFKQNQHFGIESSGTLMFLPPSPFVALGYKHRGGEGTRHELSFLLYFLAPFKGAAFYKYTGCKSVSALPTLIRTGFRSCFWTFGRGEYFVSFRLPSFPRDPFFGSERCGVDAFWNKPPATSFLLKEQQRLCMEVQFREILVWNLFDHNGW